MKTIFPFLIAVAIVSLIACNDDDTATIETPVSYEFERLGSTTVNFSGQTTRIAMAEELFSAMKGLSATEEQLLEMFSNTNITGGDANPFSDDQLNNSSKSIRNKVAASKDFFSANTTLSAQIKTDFESWIKNQAIEVFPNQNTLAEPGVAGQIADGSATRYVSSQGLEYDQMVALGLIGALMSDQISNHYLSSSILDEGDNQNLNNTGTLVDGTNYTSMEHKWDEAFGYIFGATQDYANALNTLGQDDSFLNKYLGRVDGDSDFSTIADETFDAFKLGRAAIVAGEYDLRDDQVDIIRKNISTVIGVRAVYYLMAGKAALELTPADYGAAFHDLSEGYGFIYSLQFTRRPGSDAPYFSHQEVNNMISDLLDDGQNGLWDVSPSTLENLAQQIADAFDFTVEQAASTN